MLAADAARVRRGLAPAAASRPSEPAARVVAAPVRARSLHAAGAEPRHVASRPPQFASVAELATQCSTQPRVTLVNTSVYLKPTKLLNVALDMLARFAPCLNLRVRKLGHKDLLDTIGADNRRK